MGSIRLIGALITGLTIVTLALALRIASGPIALGPVAPLLEEFIADLGGDIGIRLEDAQIAWDRADRTVSLHLRSVQIIGQDGRGLATIPQAALGFDMGSLIRGEPRPTRIDVLGLTLRLVRDQNGLGFGLESAPEPDLQPSPVPGLLQAIVTDDPESPFSKLREIRFRDAALLLDDRVLQRTFSAPDVDIAVRREAGGLRAVLDGELKLGEALVGLGLNLKIDTGTGTADVAALVDRLEPAHLGLFLPAAAADLSGVHVPLRLRLSSRADLRRLLAPVAFAVEASGGEIRLPALGADVIRPTRILADGEVAADFSKVQLRAAEVVIDDLTLRIGGDVVFEPAGPAVDVVVNAEPLSVASLKRHWPRTVGTDARDWVVENILAGQIRDVRARLRASGAQLAGTAPMPADAVALEWRVEGGEVRYFKPLPTVTAVSAYARMNVQKLDVTVSDGRVGELVVRDSVVVITGLHQKDQFADIKATVAGAVPLVLAILDREPLGFIRRFNLDPAATTGTSTTTARFKFPLAKNLSIEQLDVAADSDISGFSYPKVYERFAVSDGKLALKVDRKRLSARGNVALNGVPAQLIWVENFEGGAFASRYDLTAIVDDAGRRALGFPLEPVLTGTIGADVAIQVARGGGARLDGSFDLIDSVLTLNQIGWTKPRGQKGTARVAIDFPQGLQARILSAELSAADLTARGKGQFGPGDTRHFEIQNLKQGRNDLAVVIDVAADGATVVQASGQGFDLRPIIKDLDKPSEPKSPTAPPEPPLTVNFDVARVRLLDDVSLNKLKGQLLQRDGKASNLRTSGQLDDGAVIELDLHPDGKGRVLQLRSANAGAVIKAFGITDDVVGGTLAIDGRIADELEGAPIHGTIRIDAFKLLDAPVLARIISVAALSGIGDLLRGDGVAFTEAKIPFIMTGPNLRIDGARAHGPAMGFSAEGNINRAEETLSLAGTLVPAYAINSVLGNIPILGQLLVGRKGEGIIGITYKMSGPFADPSVAVNPLSALTPGFLRRIFEFGDGSPSQAPPPSQPEPRN
ncbi:MAG: AsmA-like C-terminal domain-containing protein [Hyphomicrobium sp.]|nr:AsmA-like C-terminal domain-containing protein [Hyphomicrobium sp.]